MRTVFSAARAPSTRSVPFARRPMFSSVFPSTPDTATCKTPPGVCPPVAFVTPTIATSLAAFTVTSPLPDSLLRTRTPFMIGFPFSSYSMVSSALLETVPTLPSRETIVMLLPSFSTWMRPSASPLPVSSSAMTMSFVAESTMSPPEETDFTARL